VRAGEIFGDRDDAGDLARLDRKRKKRMSNEEWKSSTDQNARIAKMNDGRTHLAHKAEHAVDLDTGAVVAVTLQPADQATRRRSTRRCAKQANRSRSRSGGKLSRGPTRKGEIGAGTPRQWKNRAQLLFAFWLARMMGRNSPHRPRSCARRSS
jgi:hypothetical protein